MPGLAGRGRKRPETAGGGGGNGRGRGRGREREGAGDGHGTGRRSQSLLWEGSTPGHLNDGASDAQLIQAVAGPEARLRLCWRRGWGAGQGAVAGRSQWKGKALADDLWRCGDFKNCLVFLPHVGCQIKQLFLLFYNTKLSGVRY